ncbi:MAG: MoaD/ThiS family protein [Anaerolineae bacterium]|jgi:sulfur carrier protein ThiS
MKVQLKLFATFRQYLPVGAEGSTVELEVPSGTRVTELLATIGIPQQESPMILVNGRGIDSDRILVEGDVVAVFPAMAGG